MRYPTSPIQGPKWPSTGQGNCPSWPHSQALYKNRVCLVFNSFWEPHFNIQREEIYTPTLLFPHFLSHTFSLVFFTDATVSTGSDAISELYGARMLARLRGLHHQNQGVPTVWNFERQTAVEVFWESFSHHWPNFQNYRFTQDQLDFF